MTDPHLRTDGRQRRQARKPLNSRSLHELGLTYVARFATSKGKLAQYLARKVRERGWDDDAAEPAIAELVDRFAALGYVDDEGWSRARAEGLMRRGYGARRVADALRHAGIEPDLAAQVQPSEAARRRAVVAFAEKRKLGLFGPPAETPQARQRQLGAMARAGHGFEHARAVLDAQSPDALAEWVAEAGEEDQV